ncbi:tetraacyldisaccharide 4'-kinase [uncultured Desulfosarcina sp.]|uniref:tetraacyldisaccharide 4'-kinase n=1 Tax=uncultured Desulfosarcina sp. TaxID=218289 RepID=UPI0029C63036|nr:tetraacyldisaccharide 4'-kinase [uncultured Desulfosarcina sp.]
MTGLKKIVERFRYRIETAIRGKSTSPVFSIETVLLVLSIVYGGLMCLRARLYEKGLLPSRNLPCRVVSIGNIIAGGTGKTPMTIMVARMIRDMGYRVVVISRGYRGRMEDSGGIVSDGRTIFKGSGDAGDEPYLMARILKGIPVVVGKRRYTSGMMAVKRFNPDVIVLDDAFQHLPLRRDLNLLLLDSRSPFGNGYLLPRGVLREPVSALRRAQVVIFTRTSSAVKPSIPDALPDHWPVFYTRHVPVIRKSGQGDDTFLTDTMDMSILKGKRVVAFSGLADNLQFFDSLEQAGCRLDHTFSFADHHRYGRNDLDRIADATKEKGADAIVTSLKDYVKIENHSHWPVTLVTVDVNIELTRDADLFAARLSTALNGIRYKKD